MKDNEEIEFELNCYGPDNFEVAKIEKLRPGSLQFEFKTDLDNQDRDQGIILRMPESGSSGQPGKIEYRNNADACQYLDFEMEDIIPLKTISIRVSSGIHGPFQWLSGPLRRTVSINSNLGQE